MSVTKYGLDTAKIVPIELVENEDPLAVFHYPGLEIVGDIEAPLYTDEEWEEFFRASSAQFTDPA